MENTGKVVNITEYAEYNKKLSEIVEIVTEHSDEGLFPLALLSNWKEWDSEQPIGKKLNVDEDMLRNTGDNNIDILWELLDTAEDVIDRIGVVECKKVVSNPFFG